MCPCDVSRFWLELFVVSSQHCHDVVVVVVVIAAAAATAAGAGSFGAVIVPSMGQAEAEQAKLLAHVRNVAAHALVEQQLCLLYTSPSPRDRG